jgi:RecA-family ATPase
MVVEDFQKHARERARTPLKTVSALAFADVEKPQRAFLDDAALMPMRQVVLLFGDGGVGKSLLALQLALACVTGSDWVGIGVSSGPVLYFNAEDDQLETHIRVAEICEAEHIDLHEAGGLEFLFMAGADATLGIEQRLTGTVKATDLYGELDAIMDTYGPMLVILDNLADTYGGNENNRGAAKAFIGLLRRLAMKHDCVILLLAHPSMSGMASGSGMSGSTAWNNSVRSRLYLHRPQDPTDDNARVLESMKANYGPTGRRIGLNWHGGRFVAKDEAKPFDHVKMDDQYVVAAEFSRGSWRTNEQCEDWGGYFVAELLDLDIASHGVLAAERSKVQQKNRQTVRVILATWLRNKVISKEARNVNGRATPFFGGSK